MIYIFEDCELDIDLYELRRSGRRVALEPQVFDVLSFLIQNHERVVTKDELYEHIWPEKYISEAALSSRVMAARRAIGDNGQEQRIIRTLHRRGFRFIAPVLINDPAIAGTGPTNRTVGSEAGLEQRIGFCATADGVTIAHAVVGDGPPIVKVANWLTHVEYDLKSPVWRHWFQELSREHTLVRYDERGCGLSDRDVPDFSVGAWVGDLEAVVDTLELERFVLLGVSQGGAVAIAYAVRHPERVSHLVLYGAYARGWHRQNPTAGEVEERAALLTLTRQGWGRDNPGYRQIFASSFVPGASTEQVRWFSDLCRVSASPENAVRFLEAFGEIDVEDLLPGVSMPTLVLHARGDMRAPFQWGRDLAARIPGARFVPIESSNHILLEDEPGWQVFCHEVLRFVS